MPHLPDDAAVAVVGFMLIHHSGHYGYNEFALLRIPTHFLTLSYLMTTKNRGR